MRILGTCQRDGPFTYCFALTLRFSHNPLETFILGRGDLVPRHLVFTPMVQMVLVDVFGARCHEQLWRDDGKSACKRKQIPK